MKTFQPINEVKDAKADRKKRQAFYTPLTLVSQLIEWADVHSDMRILEPSAGDGRIVNALFAAGVKKVDVCETEDAMLTRLHEMGADVIGNDFLAYRPLVEYDRIVMNPPFARNIWKKHISHAASMLAPGGRLLSIAPSTAPNEFHFEQVEMGACDDVSCEILEGTWFKEYGTNISVALIDASRPYADRRRVFGFCNLSTSNVVLSIESDRESWEAVHAKIDAREVREIARKLLRGGASSMYGVDWEEAAQHFRDKIAEG